MNLKNQIRIALGLDKPVELMYQDKLADGTIIVSEAESLTAGTNISILSEDGTQIPLPAGNYNTESGVSFTVVDEGVVSEVGEVEEEEEVEMEEEETEEVAEEVVEVISEAVAEVAEAINDATPEEVTPEIAQVAAEAAVAVMEDVVEENVDLSKEAVDIIAVIKEEMDSLRSELTNTKSELSKLSKEPAGTPVKSHKFSTPNITKDLKDMSSTERYWFNLSKN